MGEPVGAIKKEGSVQEERETVWVLTDDVNAVFSTPEEDVIYAQSAEELEGELALRYPAPDPRLKTFERGWGGAYGLCTYRILLCPRYDGTDPQAAATLAELCGKIQAIHVQGNDWLDDPKFAATCVIDGYTTIVYDPKRAKRRAASRARSATKKYVSVLDTQRLVLELLQLIRPIPDFRADPTVPRLDAVSRLVATILVLNAIRGENAHRLVPAFQKYAKNWKDRRPQTEAEWSKTEALKPFVEWMGKECVVDFPEPVDTLTWKPVNLIALLTTEPAVPCTSE